MNSTTTIKKKKLNPPRNQEGKDQQRITGEEGDQNGKRKL